MLERAILAVVCVCCLCADAALAQKPGPQQAAGGTLTIDPAELQKPWTGDLDGMIERRVIRVLTINSKTFYFNDRGTLRGTIVEFYRIFEDELNKKQDELKRAEADLEKQKAVLKPDVFEQKRQELEKKFVELQQVYVKLERDLAEALTLEPEHLSAYELEAKPGTRFTHAHGAELARQAESMESSFELVVDTIVEPHELRDELIARFTAARHKDRHFSRRRHGVTPV